MQELDSILEKYTSTDENHLIGASFVAVNEKGETLYSKSFGNRTFDGAPLQIDSVLWIASLTKLITAVALPELKDLEVLTGFEDGGTPCKPIVKKTNTPISLRQLLSHQSGFAYDQLCVPLQEWSKYHKRTDWTMTGSMVLCHRSTIESNVHLNK